jgi:long-chain fatty acid transport protein
MSFCTTLSWRCQSAHAAGLAMAGALMLASSTAAIAAEAYIQNGAGAREKALAGAGVASSTDATAVSLNPAGLTNVQSQINVSASFLNLDGGYTAGSGPGINADGHHDSKPGWVTIPNLAVTARVNWGFVDAIAFSAYGNGGVDTHYKDVANPNCGGFGGGSGVFCGGPLGITMSQSFYSVAFAKQISPGLSVGVAPILAHQEIKVEGASLFGFILPSVDPANFSDRGTDDSWGVGVRGGVEWKIAPGLRVGVAGTPRIYMSNFDKYRGLFPERGDVDMPATLQAGVAVDVMPNVTLMADYKHIWFGSVATVNNPSTSIGAVPFGADNGPGFGVPDVDVIKLGVEWRSSPKLTLRAGYSYNTAAVKSRDVDINIVTLGVVQHHITGGLKYQLTQNWDLELAAMYAPRASVSGTELLAGPRTVEIEMSQFEFTVGAVYRFGNPPAPVK